MRRALGLILCKDKNRVMAEYALRDMGKPIGISGFKLAESLPESLKGNLPTIADLEAELSGDKGQGVEGEISVEPSSGNVFADLDLPNPENRLSDAERGVEERGPKPTTPSGKASRKRKP